MQYFFSFLFLKRDKVFRIKILETNIICKNNKNVCMCCGIDLENVS